MADIYTNGKLNASLSTTDTLNASVTVGSIQVYSDGIDPNLVYTKNEVNDLLSNKSDINHKHNYNELDNLPEIPSIEGLASEEYVNDKFDSIEIPEVDLSNCATKEELNEVKQSVSDGKTLIASAITDKGVNTSNTDSFQVMANNITNIQASEYMNPDFYELRTKGGTDCSHIFYSFTGTNLDLSSFDTSNVTNMSSMFYSCSRLTSLDLSNWDTSNVTDMGSMFYSCISLTSLDLSNWDTSNVTNMGNMFTDCKSLTSLDLSSFDTSNVKTFSESIFGILYNASSLESVVGIIDLSSCNSGLSYSTSYHSFKDCKKLKRLELKNIYKNVTMNNAIKWSIYLNDTIIEDQYLVNIIAELPDLIVDKGLTSTNNITLSLPPTNTLTQEQVQPAIDKGWNVVNTTY